MKPLRFLAYGNWNPKVPTNPFLLPNALADTGHSVLFVEQTLWEKGRTLQPWSWGKRTVEQIKPNLWKQTLRPPLPRKTDALRQWFNGYAHDQISGALADLGFEKESCLHLIFNPIESYALEWLPELPYVYRVIDDYSAMPYFAHDPEGAKRLDEQLARNAVAVFPSNPKLLEMKKPLNPHTHLIANAVNFDHFSKAPAEPPADLAALPRPIIGFAGALDKYKVDFELLEAAARKRPDWSFAMLGDVGTDDKTKKEDLPQLPNVHYLGFRAYNDLPRYLRAFDVGLVPYVRNSYTEGVFPLKLYEYFAVGLSVVSTDLPFLEATGDSVYVGHNADEFVEQIERALSEDRSHTAPMRVELARQNSWNQRALDLVKLLQAALQDKKG